MNKRLTSAPSSMSFHKNAAQTDQAGWVAATMQTCMWEALHSVLSQDATYTEEFGGIPRSLQANARTLPKLYHQHCRQNISNSSFTNYSTTGITLSSTEGITK
jgi:hypothetical protein